MLLPKVVALDRLRFEVPLGDSDAWLSLGKHTVDVHSSDEEEALKGLKASFFKAAKPRPQTGATQKRPATVGKSRPTTKKKKKAPNAPEDTGKVS